MNNKIITVILLLGLILTSGVLVYEKIKFPVSLNNCAKGYTDCFVVAKYPDVDSCEYAKMQSSWLCSTNDPENIKCESHDSTVVDTYCSK
jgi:hypothetical protein